ncbi:MAG: HD domain-containing protein [Clostridia bacterium]|nr:HD domain-containing protein [Clostridia bacterium]
MDHYHIYHDELPSFLWEIAQVPAVRRLQNIGMNCGCEYTSFPRFRGLAPYSRFDHSLGVALIVWHFTQDRAQAVAGLLHDIATPVFAHVVDFMRGDYLKQESTEDQTVRLITASDELLQMLKRYDLTVEDVCDYHRYPIADNETPRLSADRLEYTIGNGINFGICTEESARRFYNDFVIGVNEDGQNELMFSHRESAKGFATVALECSRIYVSDEDRYAMQILSELLYDAIQRDVIHEDDLYTTEPEVIGRLSEDPCSKAQWEEYCAYSRILHGKQPGPEANWRKVMAKKRWIDPMVKGSGRVSQLFPALANDLKAFLHSSQDDWLCGRSR